MTDLLSTKDVIRYNPNLSALSTTPTLHPQGQAPCKGTTHRQLATRHVKLNSKKKPKITGIP